VLKVGVIKRKEFACNVLIRPAVGTVYSEHLMAISETDTIRMSRLSNGPAVAKVSTDRGADVGQNNLHLISL
jgi:hypothetical protein